MSDLPANAKDIFLAAIELPLIDRDEFVARACAGDEALREQLRALLGAHDESDNLLDQDRIEAKFSQLGVSPPATEDFPDIERPGAVIGPYKLLQVVGEGGMGVVYMAQQTKPVERRVALKIIKPGMDSRQVIARFEAERQALAMMDHPNIAKVLDAGATKSGRPYFVMELVNGISITEYCDQQHLSTRERLELFVPVCQAVQHAHQKGIIHRDLKPSNIMVALYDSRAVPKVIDFGVAKATSQSLTEKTLFTQLGQIVGTLEYMSPEQAQRNQLDIDTRSDVYSLGVVLYELLTGSPPFERQRLRSAAYEEILRIIREEEPPRPSVRLSTIETLASIAANRSIEPLRLRKLLSGELDWIVMTALEKDRARRYQTANGFAADIARYLNDEPVQACPPSASYRLRKFASKNRKLIASVLSLGAVLAIATAVSIWWAIKASNAEQAERTIAAQYKTLANENETLAETEKAARLEADEKKQEAIAERERAKENAAEARHNQYIAHMQQLRHEWNANDVGRVKELLDRYRTPIAGRIDERGWEWHYWDRMCHLDLRTLEGHTKSVNGVAFSPDSSRVASASSDGTVKLWETATGQLIQTLEGHAGPVTSIAFHPDGKKIGSGGVDKRAILWDIATGKQLFKLEHSAGVTRVAFSPNGELFATGTQRTKDGGQRKIWNVATGAELHTFSKPNEIHSISFTKDGKRIVCATDPDIEMWELESGKFTKIASHSTVMDNNFQFVPVTAAVLSPDEKTLATGSFDRTVKTWDLESGKELKSIPAHIDGVTSVAFHPSENRLASASLDRSIRVWDASTGAEELVLRGHTAAVRQIAFSPDGLRLASASGDGTVKIWDVNQRLDIRYLLTSDQHHFLTMSFRPDGHELAYTRFFSGEREMGLWAEVRDAASHHNVREFRGGHDTWIRSVAMSKDGTLLATGGGSTVQIWNCRTGKVIHVLKDFPSLPNGGLVFSPDGSMFVVDSPEVDKVTKKVTPSQKVFDSKTGEKLHAHAAPSRCIAFSPDGMALAISTEKAIEFVAPRSGNRIRTWQLENSATNLQYDSAGKVLAGNTISNNLVLWDVETGEQLLEISKTGRFIGFDSTGTRLFTVASNDTLGVWDRRTGDLLCAINSPKRSAFSSPAISADGNLIAIRNLPFVYILDIRPNGDDVSIQRESQALVAQLLKFPFNQNPLLLSRKSEVLARLQSLKSISESIRHEAARLINEVLTQRDECGQFAAASGWLVEGVDPHWTTAPGESERYGRPTDEQKRLALEYARTAYEIDRHDCVANLAYGSALCENEQYRESIEYLQRAYEDDRLNKVWATITLGYLARSLFHVGELEKAKEKLVQARASPYARMGECAQQIELAAALIERGEDKTPPADFKKDK